MKPVQITPEPDEAERAAILKALAEDDEGRTATPVWASALLPSRDEVGREP